MKNYPHRKSDRLVSVRQNTKTVVGKRVEAQCPISIEARQVYVKQGPILAVKFIREQLGIGLAEAYGLLQRARLTDLEFAEWQNNRSQGQTISVD